MGDSMASWPGVTESRGEASAGRRSPTVQTGRDTWFSRPGAREHFRARTLGRTAIVLPPRDPRWRRIAPDFETALGLVRAGVPFHTVAARRYDRTGLPRAMQRALRDGATIFFP